MVDISFDNVDVNVVVKNLFFCVTISQLVHARKYSSIAKTALKQ